MTDDPLGSGAAIAHLKAGQKVWSLAFLGAEWEMIVVEIDGQCYWGLCPDQLHVAWMMEEKHEKSRFVGLRADDDADCVGWRCGSIRRILRPSRRGRCASTWQAAGRITNLRLLRGARHVEWAITASRWCIAKASGFSSAIIKWTAK